MSTRSDLQEIIRRRLVPIVADLEKVIHRNGYIRTVLTSVLGLGVVGILGQILGQDWLKYAYGALAGIMFVLASAVSFAATQSLRERNTRSENILHEYANVIHANSPVVIREWSQEVMIERNGDAFIRRSLILGGTTGDTPRHVSSNVIYYGETPLTDRARRRVSVKVFHADRLGPSNGVRVVSTSSWTTTDNGLTRLEIYVHLGRSVSDGDIVTIEWTWPEFSKDLTSGRSPESFDVVFRKSVVRFTHSVVFRGVSDSRLRIRNVGAPNLQRKSVGQDVHLTFDMQDPEMGTKYGFVADYDADK